MQSHTLTLTSTSTSDLKEDDDDGIEEVLAADDPYMQADENPYL